MGIRLDPRRGPQKIVGDILIYEIQDNGPDQPLQAFIRYTERVTFSQKTVSVYIYGNRIEAAGIRGDFSAVADANIWESPIRSSGDRILFERGSQLGRR